MFTGKPREFNRENLLMNCRKDFVAGGILQNVVEKYFDPTTIETNHIATL